MGKSAINASKPILRGRKLREPDAYNGSSLAFELDNAAAPGWQQPMPQLVPRTAIAAPQMFKSADLMTCRKDPKSKAVSFIVHILIAGVVLWWGMIAHNAIRNRESVTAIKFSLTDPPPMVMPVAKVEGGGGGSPVHHVVQPLKPPPPPQPKAPHIQFMPAQIARLEHPKLAAEPSAQVKMPENSNMPSMGVQNSPQVALSSQNGNANSALGGGLGGGIGIGHGTGSGPGGGGGFGGGLMSVGGGVSAPIVIHSVEPEFTEEARRANYQGTVGIQIIVDSQGNPQNAHVVRHLGMGLDEKAIEAVRQYRFKPSMYQGHPVAVQMVVEVDFRLH